VDAAEEQQVGTGVGPEGELLQCDAVVNGRLVAEIGMAVGVADRDVAGGVVVGPVDGHDPLGGKAVDGGDDRGAHQPAVGDGQEIELVGQQVELTGPLESRRDVAALRNLGVDAGRFLISLGHFGVQPGGRRGVCRREQRHFVAERHQPVGEGGRHLLPGAVAAWRRAVGDGGQHPDPQRAGHR
jgi:hypothetical protein